MSRHRAASRAWRPLGRSSPRGSRRGRSKRVLAGGAFALSRLVFAGFNLLFALDPEPCRPFDVRRAGMSLGEGAAFLLLESEEEAAPRIHSNWFLSIVIEKDAAGVEGNVASNTCTYHHIKDFTHQTQTKEKSITASVENHRWRNSTCILPRTTRRRPFAPERITSSHQSSRLFYKE